MFHLIGAPSKEFDNKLCYDELELHVDFNETGKVEYIESIMGPYPKNTEISINGRIDRSEADYGFSFIDKSIGIYRSSTVEDIQEMIREMKENNDFESQKEDTLYELEKSQFF